METKIQLTINHPPTQTGAYAYPTDPDALKAEVAEQLGPGKWWLAAMPNVYVRIDGVSAEVEE